MVKKYIWKIAQDKIQRRKINLSCIEGAILLLICLFHYRCVYNCVCSHYIYISVLWWGHLCFLNVGVRAIIYMITQWTWQQTTSLPSAANKACRAPCHTHSHTYIHLSVSCVMWSPGCCMPCWLVALNLWFVQLICDFVVR